MLLTMEKLFLFQSWVRSLRDANWKESLTSLTAKRTWLTFVGATISIAGCFPFSLSAQTFTEAATSICTGGGLAVTDELLSKCQQGNQGAITSGVTQSQPNSLLISQQQLKDRKEKENKDISPNSGDVVAKNWGDFSTFLIAGATDLRHRGNDFEQFYSAAIPSVTLGGGYRVLDNLETGLAFNYANTNASSTSGAGFNIDSYSPLLYINYSPFQHAFTSLVLSYSRQNQQNNRFSVITNEFLNPPESALTRGNFNTNQYSLNFLSGYDHPIEGGFTIGPRIGVDVRYWDIRGYQENNDSFLAVRFDDQHQTSVQTNLGLAASYLIRSTYGNWIPQFNAAWVHEFQNNSHLVGAQFLQSTQKVFFQTENPARNWASIGLGVMLQMKHGLQAFANFSTVQGNRNFESYGGNLGIAMNW